MKVFQQIFLWAFWNAVVISSAIGAFIYHQNWALGVFHFYFWVTLFVSTCVLSETVRKQVIKTPRYIPIGLDLLIDFSMCLFLAGTGHVGLAIGWFWQIAMILLINGEREKAKAAE